MKEYQNEVWFHGHPVKRKALILGGIASVLSLPEGISLTVRFWKYTNPKPLCLDDDRDGLSFKRIPCQIPTPLSFQEPYSDPVKAEQELEKR